MAKSLEQGSRLPLPSGVSPVLYQELMTKGCWSLDRNHRKSFAQIRDLLEYVIRNPLYIQDNHFNTSK